MGCFKSKILLSIVTIGFMTSGCGENLEGLVRVGRLPRLTGGGEDPAYEGQSQRKISPGHQVAVSSDNAISMQAHITVTDRLLVDGAPGGTLSARVSFGRYRSQDQSASSLRAPSATQ